MTNPLEERVIELTRKAGVLRPRDLDAVGIPRVYLQRLCRKGGIERLQRGLYCLPERSAGEFATLAEVAKRVPSGVVCLLSALRFHELTTQTPHEVWLALDRKSRKPRLDLPVRVVRFSAEALSAGYEVHVIDQVPVRVYGPAKTVVDCFKYRNKIGLDVALEALQDYLRQRKGTVDELWRFAKICRVSNVMRPYLEAVL
ncbi:MAG: type IV toxin-antitoxin system AbiEi family antitoxin domain-containing protein [Deltaproteobacteria bacterium]|nr:type IV toxin-antitoxin system AbiEi family antitoxin domain-containing protein [Deltaproteobacteria bacterium]